MKRTLLLKLLEEHFYASGANAPQFAAMVAFIRSWPAGDENVTVSFEPATGCPLHGIRITVTSALYGNKIQGLIEVRPAPLIQSSAELKPYIEELSSKPAKLYQ